jgi:succinate dehydrogenase / fumarate reductase cytochrome b subunit
MRNRAARPKDYAQRTPQVSTLASKSLRIGGVILLAFVFFHIADLTLGKTGYDFVHLDPYHNIRESLGRPLVAVFYLLAVASLGLHLWHGAWASFRTLGLARASARPLHRSVAIAVAVLVVLGFAIVPIAALTGMLRPDDRLDQQQARAGASVIEHTSQTKWN